MIKSKFKEKETAYLLQLHENTFSPGIRAHAMLKLIPVVIVSAKGRALSGFHFENYGHFIDTNPHAEKRIYTKKNKVKGKEVDWKRTDTIAVLHEYHESSLLTLEEAKLKMITYIANDFNDDVCLNCTHGQDASY